MIEACREWLLLLIHHLARVFASSVVTEVRPPFLADESCFLVEELSVHTWHFLHNLALPFP